MDWLAHGFIERFANAVDRVARLKRRFTRKAGERTGAGTPHRSGQPAVD